MLPPCQTPHGPSPPAPATGGPLEFTSAAPSAPAPRGRGWVPPPRWRARPLATRPRRACGCGSAPRRAPSPEADRRRCGRRGGRQPQCGARAAALPQRSPGRGGRSEASAQGECAPRGVGTRAGGVRCAGGVRAGLGCSARQGWRSSVAHFSCCVETSFGEAAPPVRFAPLPRSWRCDASRFQKKDSPRG